MILIMLVVGYKLVFDPYRPESPNSCWSQRPAIEETYVPNAVEPPKDNYDFRTNVPEQVGETHD